MGPAVRSGQVAAASVPSLPRGALGRPCVTCPRSRRPGPGLYLEVVRAVGHRYPSDVTSELAGAPERGLIRLQLLSKIGELAGMLEYDEVLATVARLSIPELADWCIVDVVEDGNARRAEVAYRDPDRAAIAEDAPRARCATFSRTWN